MNAGAYTFDSTVELRLTNLLGIAPLRTPKIKLSGPTTVERAASTAPSPGRFAARLTLKQMNLSGKVLGIDVTLGLNANQASTGIVEGRADPHSPDPSSPDPMGTLDSSFDVYIEITTPLGTLQNREPVGMKSRIKSVPPDWARYRQYTPPRTLFDKVIGSIIADMLHATHVVKLMEPQSPVDPKPAG
jgi:hypothetical protein